MPRGLGGRRVGVLPRVRGCRAVLLHLCSVRLPFLWPLREVASPATGRDGTPWELRPMPLPARAGGWPAGVPYAGLRLPSGGCPGTLSSQISPWCPMGGTRSKPVRVGGVYQGCTWKAGSWDGSGPDRNRPRRLPSQGGRVKGKQVITRRERMCVSSGQRSGVTGAGASRGGQEGGQVHRAWGAPPTVRDRPAVPGPGLPPSLRSVGPTAQPPCLTQLQVQSLLPTGYLPGLSTSLPSRLAHERTHRPPAWRLGDGRGVPRAHSL